jgi:tRNA G18 (ribose-2'-O)-methylase SpoU
MPLFRVDSDDDPRLEPYRSLKTTNRTRRTGEFVVEGEKLVERMLKVGWPVESILLAEPALERWRGKLSEAVDVFVAPYPVLQSLVGFRFHRGALACSRRPASLGLDRLPLGAAGPMLLAVLVDVHDPENVGAILRTAWSLGASGALLSDRCADPYSRRVMRTSMGAPFSLPVAVVNDLPGALNRLRRASFQLAASVVDPAATPLDQFAPPERLALLLGTEGDGLDPSVAAACDHRVTIPMAADADSLNVAVAAGVLIHRWTRPESAPRGRPPSAAPEAVAPATPCSGTIDAHAPPQRRGPEENRT